MRRIGLAVVLAIGLALAPLSGEAQQAAKIAPIGYLSYSWAAAADLQEAFRQGLREFGYVEGRNVVVEY
jgi:putative tryptophan/tyrosine transport system substrate-binding protein